ncbi:hypothetical protein ZWY2020_048098 [Hordeum vulgare]|nr:hypothetical protein ZWY2020_048098 [Hordeum vulgare]
MARIWRGCDSRPKPTSTALPDQRRDTPGSSSSTKRGVQPTCDQGRPRICAPAADGGHDKVLPEGRPHGERGSSAYMEVSPVFTDGSVGFQHHGRTKAGSANAPAKIRRFGCSSSTNLYSCC